MYLKVFMMKSLVNLYLNKHRGRRRDSPPWWSRKLHKLRKKRLKWWKRYKILGVQADYVQYKVVMDRARTEVRKAKRRHESKMASNIKTDSKMFYKYARSKMEVKEGIVSLKDEDGRDTADVGKMTCILNQYFATVFTEEDLSDMPVPTNMCNSDEVMDEIDTSQSAVYQKLRNLDPEKAVGDDNINPAILRNVADQFAVPLSIIFTTSMKSGKIPKDWRTANVTPIYKKGSKNIASNYRPISLTSQVCKVMEKLVKESIVAHLNKRNLIRESQHGFMEGKSCLTNLLSFLETATSYSDQGLPVDILYLDFSKAFDKVPHQRLITKLKAHGIGDTVAN